jgi:hypothetical protein
MNTRRRSEPEDNNGYLEFQAWRPPALIRAEFEPVPLAIYSDETKKIGYGNCGSDAAAPYP